MSTDIGTLQEEKKSQDISLGDEDDPKTASFHGFTQAEEGHGQIYAAEDNQSYLNSDPNAPVRLAVLGPEDDLSTLAGDTLGGTVMTEGAVFSNANLPYAIMTKPRPRDFNEYEEKDLITPTKKKRWYPYMNQKDDDGDDNTQPETPHGGGGFKGGDMTNHSKDEDASTYLSYVSPSKKVYICATVIGVILLSAIIGLTVAYSQLSDDGDVSSESQAASATSGGFDPNNLSPTILVPSAPAATPGGVPTLAPVSLPTIPPLPVNGDAQLALRDLLSSTGVNMALLDDVNSPQYRAWIWLASDPNFVSYTAPRLIQRWTLAVLAMGLFTDETKLTPAASVLPLWLDVMTNECDWFTSQADIVCNGFGYYEYLSLDNQTLYGTIPTELGLLSDTLLFLNLATNKLTGTIPTELGNLLGLKRMRLNVNGLQGPIPSELGRLTIIDALSLGVNEFTGTIPTEIGLITPMTDLGLEDNNLVGPIPVQLAGLQELTELSLDKNQLSGNIPVEIGSLQRLKNFTVGSNNITGVVPPEVCALGGLEFFEADCHMVACACCTVCSSTAAPTQGATLAPTRFPTVAPTILATAPPTLRPTASPTTCNDFIEWVPPCIDVGEDLVIEFQICDPLFGDWIGIFNKNADPANLVAPFLWVWSCGSQNCRGSPQTNIVTLNQDAADAQTVQDGNAWPLKSDDYVAYLIRNVGPPYTAVLSSNKRKIQDNKC